MPITSRGFSGEISLITFSLVLGLIFWAIVKQQETLNQTILVPVTITNQPEFVELSGFDPSNVAVKFSLRTGDETLARDPGRFRINVDLGVLRNRVAISENFVEYPIDITREMLEYPERLTFSSFDDAPARVIFRARPRIARVPVTVNLVNGDSPAEGYRVEMDNVLVEPAEILVAVDEARHLLALQGQLRVTTEPVDVRGRRDQVSGLYALSLGADKGVFPLPGQAAPSVEVIVPIPEIQGRRVFEGLPIRFEAFRVGVRAVLDPPTATVTIEGPQSIVSRLEPEDILLLPRQVAFLDEESVGEIVDTSIDVRFGDDAGDVSEKIRPPLVTPSLVKISFVLDDSAAPEDAEIPATEPDVEVEVDPVPSQTPLDPPSDGLPATATVEPEETVDSADPEKNIPQNDEVSVDLETEMSDEQGDASPRGDDPAAEPTE